MNRRSSSRRLHGAVSQKAVVFILAAVTTGNLTWLSLYICMYVCMYVCMYACMHVCVYVCSLFKDAFSVTKTLRQ
jgi:hypothetical protein